MLCICHESDSQKNPLFALQEVRRRCMFSQRWRRVGPGGGERAQLYFANTKKIVPTPRPNPHSFLPADLRWEKLDYPCLLWELLLAPWSARLVGRSSFCANCDFSEEWGHWTRKLNLAQFYSSHPLWRRLMITILTLIYQTTSEVNDSQSFLYFAPRLLGLLSVLFLFGFWKVKNVKCKTN